jgi:hypothetical protein
MEDLNFGLKTKKILLDDLLYKINMCMSVEYINRQTVTTTQIKIQVSLEAMMLLPLFLCQKSLRQRNRGTKLYPNCIVMPTIRSLRYRSNLDTRCFVLYWSDAT